MRRARGLSGRRRGPVPGGRVRAEALLFRGGDRQPRRWGGGRAGRLRGRLSLAPTRPAAPTALPQDWLPLRTARTTRPAVPEQCEPRHTFAPKAHVSFQKNIWQTFPPPRFFRGLWPGSRRRHRRRRDRGVGRRGVRSAASPLVVRLGSLRASKEPRFDGQRERTAGAGGGRTRTRPTPRTMGPRPSGRGAVAAADPHPRRLRLGPEPRPRLLPADSSTRRAAAADRLLRVSAPRAAELGPNRGTPAPPGSRQRACRAEPARRHSASGWEAQGGCGGDVVRGPARAARGVGVGTPQPQPWPRPTTRTTATGSTSTTTSTTTRPTGAATATRG